MYNNSPYLFGVKLALATAGLAPTPVITAPTAPTMHGTETEAAASSRQAPSGTSPAEANDMAATQRDVGGSGRGDNEGWIPAGRVSREPNRNSPIGLI